MSPGVNGTVTVSCTAMNTGQRAGKLAIQFYVQSPETWVGQARPFKELKAFAKVALDLGQSKVVTVELDKYSVSIYDEANSCWQAKNATYNVLTVT
jgi:beta-glucosidase